MSHSDVLDGGTGNRVGRRRFVGGALGLAAAASLTAAGCSAGSPSGSSQSGGSTVVHRPSYIPAKVARPDHPATAAGADAAYLKFPHDLVTSVPEPPGKGGSFTALVLGVGGLPTPMARNAGWQQLNAALGTTLNMNIVNQPDYAAKWGTLTAGNDIPDIMYISAVPALPNVYPFLQSACANLTEFIGDDAVKDYPNLANYPSTSWNVTLFDGQVWGVPAVRSVAGFPMYVQTSLMKKLGIAEDFPKNTGDFTALCKELTDEAAGRWALGVTNDTTTGPYGMYWFQSIFRAPNNWRLNADGSLVKDIETDEYAAALEYLAGLVKAGYVSPDAKPNGDLTNDMFDGKIAMRVNSWASYQNLYTDQAFALKQTYRALPPFGHDGGKPGNLLAPGNFGYAVIKKGSDDRVKQMLGILNYFAAPFGTKEYMAVTYGKEGVDYTYNAAGSPIYTSTGNQDLVAASNPPWTYIGRAPNVLFSRNVSEFADYAYNQDLAMLKAGIADPTQGFYSPTYATKGVQLDQLIADQVTGIAAGRSSMSALAELVKTWKAQGGDQVRQEFQTKIAAAK